MTPKEKLLRSVQNARGNDLERAERAFGHMTPEQLQQEWGLSGKTCGAILEEYRQERAEWEAAYALAKTLP